MDQETFPQFSAGDVRIAILPDIYQLHSWPEDIPSHLWIVSLSISLAQLRISMAFLKLRQDPGMKNKKTRCLWCNLLKIFYALRPTLENGGMDRILQNSMNLADLGEEI
ncbi:hypothetical protein P175DRAFT_0554537 [Aspergillus ochraceoroseus IBT 24754]|uniref:Uncharacterized protein n=1 Tax=Aspergillus ochraceoroseus IBT 24754 TaxID=1392256 RepID=A0A2T5M9S5_9EURO|nr:uncharacterized protein P175DRAFT_0554537 [Aspergillus ochraceoroseus IBT 24754]PTU25292.1 hypothetical protein P175DRAFT_0554537 [Aspergillus ochraceoroseus IBT 24754]